jgi:DNA-binding NtrC family response regulator
MPLSTTVVDQRSESVGKSYSLLVLGGDLLTTVPLPDTGSLTIGRADAAEVRLTDPLASRLHARLHVGAGGTFEIEDLGSINRTRIRELLLEPGQRVGVVPGETITIGSTLLIIQESRALARPRRVWPHAYFEARLEEEVARSQDSRAPFAALRLHVDQDPGPVAFAEGVAGGLRLPDMLAVYGPHEYEILLPLTTPELAGAIARDLVERLRARGIAARAATACFPRDGRTPEALLELACERVRGGPPAPDGKPDGPRAVVVQDAGMRRLYELVERAAVGTINILIVGETGVGKEIVAEAVHRLSPRVKAPFLCINCAAFSESLLESELFGHERGAFTGASEAKPGLLETAPGGTVFLDEIGEMPQPLQAKLLRVIETRQVTRVGSVKPRPIDVRFVSATNRNLEQEVAQGRFRRDLFFRLNGITLQVPPLRERRAEILPLARLFLDGMARQLGRAEPPALAPDAAALLESYAWPGNVRELKNVIERASLLCLDAEVTAEYLPVEIMETNSAGARPTPAVFPAVDGGRPTPGPVATPRPGDEGERELILRALDENAWNQTRAARKLGMARSTFVAKLEAYKIARPRKPVA